MNLKNSQFFYLVPLLFSLACSVRSTEEKMPSGSVKEVMDGVITRLYEQVPEEEYQSVDDEFMLHFLTEQERHVLATKYQYFKVNVPVTVSLMRSKSQNVVPFWMESSGFKKTDMTVKNEEYEYEVWKKDFDAGWVSLGINGFDMHRVVYFICVGPKDPDDHLEISEYFPGEYAIETMKEGAFTYHDWSDLEITEFPDYLEGQLLFTTVRGRAREAHVRGAFRKTPFPSSSEPDQVMLTWSGDPSTSMDVQWRASRDVPDGIVKYWVQNSSDTLKAVASKFVMEDRMLYNDRYVHRFTASLGDLKPGTGYSYVVGSEEKHSWSDVFSFQTKKKDSDKFSFIWFGDTHRDPDWADMLIEANNKHSEIAFNSIAGDLVSTGLYRNEWDEFFGYSKEVFACKPLMPVPGNHDRQDGLGAWMYYELFSLPKNGPPRVSTESTYAFEYGNALFLMIDSTHPNEDQTAWIEDKLKNSSATWKFVMFHFPPYNFEEPYFDIQEEWCGIFDTYHVDMIMGGHVHYYMRSKPIFNGEAVNSFSEGTVYAVSIGTKANHDDIGEEPYAEKRYKEGQFYQHMEIDGNVLKYTSYKKDGSVADKFSITK